MFRLRRPERGDRIVAEEQREVVRALEAAHNVWTEGPVSIDRQTAGTHVEQLPRVVLGQFQLTTEWENTLGCGSSSGVASSSGTAIEFPADYGRILARPVMYYYGSAEWKIVAADQREPVYLFHPSGYPPNEREALIAANLFQPRVSLGDRVWAIFHNDSGWWEIIQDYESIWRFELKTDLAVGGTADAYLRMWDPDAGGSSSAGGGASGDWVTCTGIVFTLYDHMDLFEGSAGTRGICKFFADALHWEILIMGCP